MRALACTALILQLALLAACSRPPLVEGDVPVGGESVARFTDVAAGDDCAHGGQRLEVGLDRDGDGKLADDEVQSSALLCDGAPGAGAAADLMRLVPGVLASCGGPGVRVEIGRDADGDLLLDDDEVRDGGDVCGGAAGARGGAALVDVADAPACPEGGSLVRVGLDGDDDGALADDEVLTSRAVCHGASSDEIGDAGSDGANVRVEVVLEEVECDAGGQRVRIGRDADGSGALEDDEVSESVVLCHGVEGQAGAAGPGSGASEGSAAAPVALSVTSFGDLQSGHAGGVAGGGRSYYSFTTRADHGPMPYTFALLEAESDLVVTVAAGDGTGTAVAVRCHDEVFADAAARVCDSDPLAAGTAYALTVRDVRNVANTYVLTVSAGAQQGTAHAPVTVDASALATDDVVRRGAVRELGESFYRFTAPLTDHLTVALEAVDAPDGEPVLGWSLYDGDVRDDRLLSSCAAPACPTRSVPAGADLVLVVTAAAPRPAAFDVRVSAGDDVTPALPVGVTTDAAAAMQLVPDSSGGYSIYLAGGRYRVAENIDDDTPLVTCHAMGNDACYFELDGGTRYYLLSQTTTDGRVAFAQASAGQEGSLTSPVALALDTARVCSTEHERYGDNGSVAAESYYAFTTTGAGVYAIEVVWEQPGQNLLDPLLYADGLFAEPVSVTRTTSESDRRVYVTAPLAAATTHPLVFRSFDALTFTLRPSVGDGGVALLPVDGSVVAAADYGWSRIDLAESGPVVLTVAGLSGTLTLNFHPDSPASPRAKQLTASSDRTLDVVLPAGTYYLQLTGTAVTSATISASLPPVTTLALGTAHTRAGLPAGAADWYRFDSVVEAVHTLSIQHDTSGGGHNASVHELHSEQGVRQFVSSVIGSSSLSLLPGGTPLPPGRWFLRVNNGHSTLFIDYDVQVSAP